MYNHRDPLLFTMWVCALLYGMSQNWKTVIYFQGMEPPILLEQLWAWEYETDDGKHDLFMDIGEEIRFRVVDEIFVDTTPSGPDGTANQPSEISDTESKKTPYTIVSDGKRGGQQRKKVIAKRRTYHCVGKFCFKLAQAYSDAFFINGDSKHTVKPTTSLSSRGI
uniref:DNA-directed RNA polymerase III subunit RPC8 n=1 Tax=Magallana gigas TaxID=29159 RepID=K1PAV3_MAGGI